MFAPLMGSPKKLSVKRYCLFWPIVLILWGVGMHYIFVESGCNFAVGLSAPVNGSVFEHTKMMTFPLALCWLIDGVACFLLYDGGFHLIAGTAAVYTSVGFMLIVYFLMSTVIG
jgi:hypothetical protein